MYCISFPFLSSLSVYEEAELLLEQRSEEEAESRRETDRKRSRLAGVSEEDPVPLPSEVRRV